MKNVRLRAVALFGAVAIAVAACGGGGPNSNEPTGAVTAAFDAAKSGGLSKMADFACAAKKDDIAAAFGGEGLGQLTALGISPDDLFNSMQMSFENVNATEKSRDGSTAVVHVTGDMKISFDRTKFKDILKKIMEAQGQTLDDAALEMMMGAMEGQLSQTQKMDEDITVVQEGGKWLICD
jgi:hypothetical protein